MSGAGVAVPGPAVTRRALRRQRRTAGRRSAGATVVGVLGELLITLGVLLGLFVFWQLFWTDVVAERAQEQVVQDLGWARTGDAAPDTVVAAPDAEQRDPAPVMDAPPHGTTFATLAVPRWGPDYVQPISEGVTRADVLDVLGIGHYPGTQMPGEIGNFAIAAHRNTYGKPFHRVEELRLGDALVVQTEDAWYVYRVSATQIVLPQDVDVIAPVPGDPTAEPTTAMITMTTCHPLFSSRERFIVHGELDYWMPTDAGIPVELTGGEGS
ncbi:MAG: class E sortase [Actinotalea sp.]|nr:class E sortase [Actinotalea sp.]